MTDRVSMEPVAFVRIVIDGGHEGKTIKLQAMHESVAAMPPGLYDFVPTVSRAQLQAAEQKGRREALEIALAACERIADEYEEREGRKYPELKSDAETGASDCESAIRALIDGGAK